LYGHERLHEHHIRRRKRVEPVEEVPEPATPAPNNTLSITFVC
jgi:hypothetical protein